MGVFGTSGDRNLELFIKALTVQKAVSHLTKGELQFGSYVSLRADVLETWSPG